MWCCVVSEALGMVRRDWFAFMRMHEGWLWSKFCLILSAEASVVSIFSALIELTALLSLRSGQCHQRMLSVKWMSVCMQNSVWLDLHGVGQLFWWAQTWLISFLVPGFLPFLLLPSSFPPSSSLPSYFSSFLLSSSVSPVPFLLLIFLSPFFSFFSFPSSCSSSFVSIVLVSEFPLWCLCVCVCVWTILYSWATARLEVTRVGWIFLICHPHF